ncbi:unnamed protein product [Camellia sinensis]
MSHATASATAAAASSQNLGAMEEERIEEISVRLVGRTGDGDGSASAQWVDGSEVDSESSPWSLLDENESRESRDGYGSVRRRLVKKLKRVDSFDVEAMEIASFQDHHAKCYRDEISGCSEEAYDSLSINDARKLLMFSSDQELFEYIKEEHPEWEIKNGFVIFHREKQSSPCKDIPSLQLINQTLSYARELERIV